jgi:hypothetical protein
MKVAVIGLGAAGARCTAQLRADGHQVLTVAPSGADAADPAGLGDPAAVAAWVVAAPPPAHLALVRRLLRLDPAARILLEQPACPPQDLPALLRVLDTHPGARVIVNDVYAYSPAVRRFAGLVRAAEESGPGDRIVRITVEFTKNRERDIARGRCVDPHYGAVGYEWLHMLAIVRSVLPRAEYERYLRTPPALVTPEMRMVSGGGPRLPEIELYASTHGRVGFPRIAGDAYSYPIGRRRIARGHIPYGSELRYRFADVAFASGARVTLVFEPGYQTALDYKNTHAVLVRDAGGHRTHPVVGNQLREALAAQLAALTDPGADQGLAGLRLPEHHHLAALAGYPQAHHAGLTARATG